MQSIITAKEKTFTVRWCGLSTIDFALRFEVSGESMSTVLATFTDPEETATITHKFDEFDNVYSGYTTFKGVDLKPNGNIVVSLMEG